MSAKFAGLLAIVLVTAQPALASSDADKMKGIGLPIIFGSFFLIAVVLSLKQLIAAFRASSGQPDMIGVFCASMLCALFSLFFYVSAAWAYGIVSTILAYFLACISTGSRMRQYGKFAASVFFIWFLILLGIPSQFTNGIIPTATQGCIPFYGTYSKPMCKDGWITFLLIVASVQISLTFLCVLVIIAASVGSPVSADFKGIRNNGGIETAISGADPKAERLRSEEEPAVPKPAPPPPQEA